MPMRAKWWFAIFLVLGLIPREAVADLRVLEEGDSARVETDRRNGTSRIRILVETDGDTTESSIECPAHAPRPPRPPHARVGRHDDSGDIVRFGEDIEIRADQLVEGAVVAIGGDVTVYGHVLDDVAAIGGDVNVESGAVVEGNTVAVGGRVHRSPGSTVFDGDISVPVFLPGMNGSWWGQGVRLGLILALIAFLVLSGGVVDLVMPDRLLGLTSYVQNRIWAAFFAGVAAEVLSLPAFILLCVTILGIPIALLLPFAYFFGLLVGYVAVAVILGSRLASRDVTE
ncbi:MAG: hypothetical protein R3E12_16635, partial [Candidatus Eisenbacteria bacterium]